MSYTYNQMASLLVGELFWECSQYGSTQYAVTREPEEFASHELRRNQIEWYARDVETGEEQRFLVTEGLENYGPKIHSHKAYLSPDDLRG